MDCLIDFIGLDSCTNTTTPESGVYINSLEGIELKQIKDIADDDQQTFLQAWNDVQQRAMNRFNLDVTTMFSKRYKKRNLKELLDIGRNLDIQTTYAPSANYQGHTIELTRHFETQWVNSQYSAVFISTISFYAVAAGTYALKVINLEDGSILATYSIVAAAAGLQSKKINATFNYQRLAVVVDATSVTCVKLDITNRLVLKSNCCGQAYVSGCSFSTTLGNLTQVNYTQGQNTFGVSTIFSVVCLWDNLVCLNKFQWLNAWKYCLGIELMNERLYTSRLNRWTTTDKVMAKELKAHYTLMYYGGTNEETDDMSEGYLTQSVDLINLDCHDSCFECDQQIVFRTSRL